jgi:hypothetical protein
MQEPDESGEEDDAEHFVHMPYDLGNGNRDGRSVHRTLDMTDEAEHEKAMAGMEAMLEMAERDAELSHKYLTDLFGVIKRAKNIEQVRIVASQMWNRLVEEKENDIRKLEAMSSDAKDKSHADIS